MGAIATELEQMKGELVGWRLKRAVMLADEDDPREMLMVNAQIKALTSRIEALKRMLRKGITD